MLCRAEDSALLVVDMQSRLAQAMPAADIANVARNIEILMRAADALKVSTIVTEQYPQGLGHTLEALMAVLPRGVDQFEKTCFSACGVAEFRDTLAHSGKNQIVLCGMEAHVCVLQTAAELIKDYAVFVVADAVCSRKPEHREQALRRLDRLGAVITNTESVLFEWLGDARHKQFKTLSALIK